MPRIDILWNSLPQNHWQLGSTIAPLANAVQKNNHGIFFIRVCAVIGRLVFVKANKNIIGSGKASRNLLPESGGAKDEKNRNDAKNLPK